MAASVHRIFTARRESAASDALESARHAAGDHFQIAAAAAWPRQSRQQTLGIRMLWAGENRFYPAFFDNASGIQHHYPLAGLSHDAEVMRDENDADLPLALQDAQEVENLRLDRNIQRGSLAHRR